MKNILSLFRKHSGRSKRYVAFTLAEVLITLGIIGIVAAMTIPTLVNKVQKHEYVVALKKFYTTQSSGWAQLLADEGVQNLEDTSVFQNWGGSIYCSVTEKTPSCSSFYDSLKKYFRFEIVRAPSYQLHYFNGNASLDYTNKNVFVFSDGSIMPEGRFYKAKFHSAGTQAQIAAGGGHMYYAQAELLTIDVNGFKKPNTWGRDVFMFVISGDGKLYPVYGNDEPLFHFGNTIQYWRNYGSYCGTPGSTDISNSNGVGCAARIMEEGWEMNY